MRARLATQLIEPPPSVQVSTLLIAMDLPDSVRLSVYSWGRQALADLALCRVSESSLHMPLLFLGHRRQSEVVRYLAAIRKACDGLPGPVVELRDPEPRPSRGRPRLLALPAVSLSAEVLQVELRAVLDAWSLRFFEPEDRPILAPSDDRPSAERGTITATDAGRSCADWTVDLRGRV